MKDFGNTMVRRFSQLHDRQLLSVQGDIPRVDVLYSMTCFYIKIARLAEIYLWSRAVLELAIAYMNDITTNERGLTVEAWRTFPQE
jgi:hypothetical protein